MESTFKIFTDMNSTSKIIVLDFQNAKLENVENWLNSSNRISDENTKHYIRNTLSIWNEYENPVEMLYIINEFNFAITRKNKSLNIEIYDFFKEEIMQHLVPIKLQEIEDYLSVIIDWIFNTHKTKPITALELRAFQKYKEEDVFIFPNFVTSITSLDVEELGFTLKEFFVPLNMKFKNIYSEFKKHNSKSSLRNIKLTKIFILDKYILGYTFREENKEEEHFLENIHLEDLFSQIEPIKFDDEIENTVDSILDKINKVGIVNLTDEEIIILQNQKGL